MSDWTDGVYNVSDYNAGAGGIAGAAFGVAVMVVFAALILVVLKKSGFRAMVAVGPRG
jgi:hypothetical protein